MDGCDNMVEFVKEDYGNSGRGRKRYHDCGPLLRFHGSSVTGCWHAKVCGCES